MAKEHKPVSGSRGYWPKKRAKSIYVRFRSHVNPDQVKPLDFAAYKVGMTSVKVFDKQFAQNRVIPVTVLECRPLVVAGIKTFKKTLYGLKELSLVWSEKLSRDLTRKTNLPKTPGIKLDALEKREYDNVRLLVYTKPRESGMGKKKPELFEVELAGSKEEKMAYARSKLGQEISIGEIFKDGDYIDVRAVTKGKGIQGPIKRFGIKKKSRKATKKRRHPGPLGSRGMGRVLPGMIALPGQLGFQTRTEYNKKIIQIGIDGLNPKEGWNAYGLVKAHYVLVSGSVPGPRKRLVMMRHGIRAGKSLPEEVKEILL